MKQRNTIQLCVALLIGWWLMWLAVSQSKLNLVIAPSATALAHFAALLVGFALGAAFIRITHRTSAPIDRHQAVQLKTPSPSIRFLVYALGSLSSLLLFRSLQLADAFSTPFFDYHAKLRVSSALTGGLTGIKLLDTMTKAACFPISYGVLLVVLGFDIRPLRMALGICLCNFAMYSYLWQVNYPLVHLFWLAVFYLICRYSDGVRIDWRTPITLVITCLILLASAMNRYGGDDWRPLDAARYYLAGYHMVGFSFYDFHLADSSSILHSHTYGRSSLGFLEQAIEHGAKVVDGGYVAASSENSDFNNTEVPIRTDMAPGVNAFGTLAFTFYRDFGVVGIAAGGFAFGAAIVYSLLNRRQSWLTAGIFYLTASAWMMGMMVSPVEQMYFWFCVLLLAAFRLAEGRHRRPVGPRQYAPTGLRYSISPSNSRK